MQTDPTTHNIVACCWGFVANSVASVCMGLKVSPVSNYTQQVPTLLWFHANGRNKSQHFWAQQCWVLLANNVGSVCMVLKTCSLVEFLEMYFVLLAPTCVCVCVIKLTGYTISYSITAYCQLLLADFYNSLIYQPSYSVVMVSMIQGPSSISADNKRGGHRYLFVSFCKQFSGVFLVSPTQQ